MNEKQLAGLKVFSELQPELAGGMKDAGSQPKPFADELGGLAMEYPFGTIWTRDGLDRRSRSLVMLGMLIALRAENELAIHMRIAINNGVTEQEIKEVIYQASAYCGFPAASMASSVAEKVFGEKKD